MTASDEDDSRDSRDALSGTAKPLSGLSGYRTIVVAATSVERDRSRCIRIVGAASACTNT